MGEEVKNIRNHLRRVAKNIDLETDELPTNVYSVEEIVLIASLINSLTRTEGLTLSSDLPIDSNLQSIGKFAIDAIRDQSNLLEINDKWLNSDYYGMWLQQSLEDEVRKRLAANYTREANNIIQSLGFETSSFNRIIDPFAGSSRLLTAILNMMECTDHVELIHANELMPTAAWISFLRLRRLFPEIDIQVTSQNAFDIRGKYDLVIMNPPFTRSHRITDKIKESLGEISERYEDDYKQSGLHIWAIYHADMLLQSGGQVISVLPAASIMSRYSQQFKKFLLNQYGDTKFWTFQRSKAFSQASSLKELVIKSTKGSDDEKVTFITLQQDLDVLRESTAEKSELKTQWNWTSLYSRPEIIDINEKLIEQIGLVTAESLDLNIKRGIELYGPNFFFFPNKYYTIDYPSIVHKETKKSYFFDHANLVPIVRRPSLYKKYITPPINEYCLVVEDVDEEFEEYARENKEESMVARRKFGDDWMYHTRDQINRKQPRGQIFIIDKLDLTRSATLAYYTDRQYLCTKNFYVIKITSKLAKKLAAWMNSTFYLSLYLSARREIGGAYGRMQIIDYYEEKLFPPDLTLLGDEVLDVFDELRKGTTKSMDEQISSNLKMALDEAIAEALGLELDVDLLHTFIQAEFEELKVRTH